MINKEQHGFECNLGLIAINCTRRTYTNSSDATSNAPLNSIDVRPT